MPTHDPAARLRLRVKLGTHEFEAVGSPEVVASHFRTWQGLVARLPRQADVARAADTAPASRTGHATEAPELFVVDPQRELVTLRHYPGGKDQHADAALLLLYGFHRFLDGDGRAVAVTRLKAALAASGYTDGRINRTLERYRAAGLVAKRGQRKGSRYQLTVNGNRRAAALVDALEAAAAAE